MSAKEMFEELDYEYENLNGVIRYTKNDGGYVQQIIFYEIGHRIRFREWEEYENYEPQGQSTIYMEHLQAINKQVEELHWNDTIVNIDVKLDGKKVMEAMRGGNNA